MYVNTVSLKDPLKTMTTLRLLFSLCMILCSICFTTATSAAERHALVIGNGDYGSGFSLENPQTDSRAIADKLAMLGYQVHRNGAIYDLELDQFHNAIDEFLSTIRDGDNTLIYYAGHGAASGGSNYLIPILPEGVTLRSDSDVRDRSISLQSILERVDAVNPSGVNVYFMDACRDAPVVSHRSINLTGLTSLDNIFQPQGTFIGFSTEYGKLAVDDDGTGFSPFASAVLANLDTKPDQPIELFYKSISNDVFRSTQGEQFPIQEPKIRGAYCIVECEAINTDNTETFSSDSLTSTATQPAPAVVKEKKGLSTGVKILGVAAAILVTGAILSSSDSGGGSDRQDEAFTITLNPPGQ